MKEITEKQIIEWKEELSRQITVRDNAQKVLNEANYNINLIQGGINFGELTLKKVSEGYTLGEKITLKKK
tara:strand:- start:173 stop:382 length:210 start_codon:yes stop_codon:yes gene_type:complete